MAACDFDDDLMAAVVDSRARPATAVLPVT